MESSKQYGNIFIRNNEETGVVEHYVEKPENCVTSTISCGIYAFSTSIFEVLKTIYKKTSSHGPISLERDVFPTLCASEELFGLLSTSPFVQIKSAASAISASSLFLLGMNNLSTGENIIGDVFIHPTATVDAGAKLGPNVTIGAGAVVEKGTRIKNSIVLEDCHIKEHTLIMDSVIGWNSEIGKWCRIEGTPPAVNPDKPFARLESDRLFDSSGRLIPSSTILGKNTFLADELVVRNSIVMPAKKLNYNISNQIVL
ncbi:Oidioi.mRNA.OKI2018_I69.chr1.g2633.t1.cds [Oikopleura dioica]|uniref:Oidioi.mRNA.OKI2018_I69.chr1.g2633.t1.cds n=1 Tax=Oikopleura dioica TaxID=34765 RepID=A0ABN7SRL7_OIKDI|nr:Oidioi.mRNA.OKI2018_I69.chr1.g2633.t1.cds [Oikopleura dioica]